TSWPGDFTGTTTKTGTFTSETTWSSTFTGTIDHGGTFTATTEWAGTFAGDNGAPHPRDLRILGTTEPVTTWTANGPVTTWTAGSPNVQTISHTEPDSGWTVTE